MQCTIVVIHHNSNADYSETTSNITVMIKVNNLKFSYTRSGFPVLDNFSIDFEPGKIYGLLGKNGSGKSTLLYLLAGLLRPKNGSVTHNGEPTFRRSPAILSETYIVPEVIETPNRTILEHAKELGSFYPRFDKDFLDFCIKEFEIESDKSMTQMSMGQRKKAYVSLALATRPRLLLMDEPSNGMDIPSKSQFRKVIAAGADDDSTIIISTHQAHDIENLIDQIVIIDNTRLLINVPLQRVTDRLSLRLQALGQSVEGAIFSQPVLGGIAAIYPATGAPDDTFPIDLETLFNAVLSSPQQFSQILNENPCNDENK